MFRLLTELGSIEEAAPGAKSLVFSSWGRLLRLTGEALKVGGEQILSMFGILGMLKFKALAFHRPRISNSLIEDRFLKPFESIKPRMNTKSYHLHSSRRIISRSPACRAPTTTPVDRRCSASRTTPSAASC